MELMDAIEQRRHNPSLHTTKRHGQSRCQVLACRRNTPFSSKASCRVLILGFHLSGIFTHYPISPPLLPSLMYIVVSSKTSLWLAIGPTLRLTTRIGPGPFQASLLSLVPKTSKPGKYRAVHNFSYLHEPALDVALINSWIDSNNFPCTWGTFTTVAPIIMHLLPGSQPAQQFQPCVSQGCVVCCCCQLLP